MIWTGRLPAPAGGPLQVECSEFPQSTFLLGDIEGLGPLSGGHKCKPCDHHGRSNTNDFRFVWHTTFVCCSRTFLRPCIAQGVDILGTDAASNSQDRIVNTLCLVHAAETSKGSLVASPGCFECSVCDSALCVQAWRQTLRWWDWGRTLGTL